MLMRAEMLVCLPVATVLGLIFRTFRDEANRSPTAHAAQFLTPLPDWDEPQLRRGA